jgi:methylenetetrahydrofolate dehydrogenase (NADP+) / methenyltetrahydrofolate cyclohydrolase
MKILDGTATARALLLELHQEIKTLAKRAPQLAFILIGNHPASRSYVNAKKKRCQEAGIHYVDHELDETTTETQLLNLIADLNANPLIDGILVQLPLPPHFDKERILMAIDPDKDVDGFHPVNMGKLLLGCEDGFIPCTPAGIVELLKRNGISCEGKKAVIVGRSNIVGKPLAALLVQNRKGLNATVTIAHSRTPHLQQVCLEADILVAAIGQPHFITAPMVKNEAIVIDVGINRLSNGQIVGDVDFEGVKQQCSFITPVPGGIGPMTIALLLQNTWKSHRNKHVF